MLAMAREIPPGTIKPLDYWPRLRSAFESAAAEADDYPGLICAAGKRLGVGVASIAGGERIHALRPGDFEPLRAAYTDRALYVVILAQVMRDEAKEATLGEEAEQPRGMAV